jgi:RNA polymerase sigma-70 factor (sigma-E family)
VRGAATRDAEFADFFAGRFDGARRVAHALCGDWSEAEELAQTAFVRLYAKWSSIRMETVDAYLRTILTRVFLDTRRRGRAREHPVAEPPDRPGRAHEFGTEDREALHAALLAVPPRQRAVLVLRFVADLSTEETARTLKCSTGTVKSQTARGLATLRAAYLGPDDRQPTATGRT